MVYNCKFCGREYKEKFNHDRHAQTCEFLSKSRREQQNEIDAFEKLPTQREMFLLVQDLSIRITKLEKENTELKQSVKRKLKFHDILNQATKPEFTFETWTDMLLDHVEKFLVTVFHHDLLYASVELFQHFLDTYEDRLPIRAYDVKPNKLYIYDTDNVWTPITTEDFNKVLARISHRFLVEFNRCWFMVHREKIETEEEYKNMYMNYYLKILGGDREGGDELRYQKIRSKLYGKLKKNIRSTCIDEGEP
jgi:hypothetical protein